MIQSIHIDGFRLLDDFEADFGGLTVVIGANATGKSTLIDCLRFIARSVEYSLDDVVGGEAGLGSLLTAAGQHDRLAWEITYQKPKDHPYWSADTVRLEANHSYVYKVEIAKDQFGQALPIREVLCNQEPYPGYSLPLVYLDATPQKCSVWNQAERKLVPFDEAIPEEGLFQSVVSTKEDSASDDLTKLAELSEKGRSLRLAQMRFYNEYPVLSWSRTLLNSPAFYPGFDVGRHSALRTKPADIKPLTTMAENGENLGTVLHELLTRAAYKSTADELKDFLRVAYPSFDDIFAETALGAAPKVLVRVKEKGLDRSMELWELSDGVLRFLCLSSALLNPMPPMFIAVDEPEIGLHPRLLPIVADMIKTASESTQVLVTTHSPDLLNCFGIDDIAVMSRDKNKISWLRPGARMSLRKMLENVVGDSLGDLHRSGELEAL